MTWVGWIKIWGNFALLFEIFIFTAKLCCFLSRFAIQTLLRFPSRAKLCFEISTQGNNKKKNDCVAWEVFVAIRCRLFHSLSLQRSQVGGGCIGRKHRNPGKLPFVSHSTKLGQLPLNQFFFEKKRILLKGFPKQCQLVLFPAIASFSPFPVSVCFVFSLLHYPDIASQRSINRE